MTLRSAVCGAQRIALWRKAVDVLGDRRDRVLARQRAAAQRPGGTATAAAREGSADLERLYLALGRYHLGLELKATHDQTWRKPMQQALAEAEALGASREPVVHQERPLLRRRIEAALAGRSSPLR